MKVEWQQQAKQSMSSCMLWVRSKKINQIKLNKTMSLREIRKNAPLLQNFKHLIFPRETKLTLCNKLLLRIRQSRSKSRDWTRLERKRKESRTLWREESLIIKQIKATLMLMSQRWQLHQRDLRLIVLFRIENLHDRPLHINQSRRWNLISLTRKKESTQWKCLTITYQCRQANKVIYHI